MVTMTEHTVTSWQPMAQHDSQTFSQTRNRFQDRYKINEKQGLVQNDRSPKTNLKGSNLFKLIEDYLQQGLI